MAGVDKLDTMLSSINCIRKSTKWYKKLFFQILDYCVLDVHAMYKIRVGKNIPFAEF